MSKVKITMLSLLAVFALSAAASATASANTHQWLIEGTPLSEKSTEEFQGNNLPYAQEGQFETALLGLNVHVYCQTAIIPSGPTNVLEGGAAFAKVKVKVEFSGCGVFQVNNKGISEPLSTCKIEKEPIVAEAEGELAEAGILTLKEIAPPFSKFSITKVNASALCAAEAKVEVKGTQVCVIPHFSVALYVHVLECTPGGSKLTVQTGEPSRLYLGTGIALKKGGKFSSS